jgi:hypothetical protein
MFRFAMNVIGAFGIVAASFWATTAYLDWRDRPPERIAIVEASYGLNCSAYRVTPPAINTVARGNWTRPVATACNGRATTCSFPVNVTDLGDPAPGCEKDFVVKWKCDGADRTNERTQAKEAHGKTVTISCPPP